MGVVAHFAEQDPSTALQPFLVVKQSILWAKHELPEPLQPLL
jgi:hypothetical protein